LHENVFIHKTENSFYFGGGEVEKIYHLGNTTVTIVAPVITEEEKLKRLRNIESHIYHLLKKKLQKSDDFAS
jgi:hypothetical protein